VRLLKLVAGVVAAVILLTAACGDDSDSGEDVAASDGDDVEATDDSETEDTGTDDADIDPCTLLEVEEIEAEFGDAGPVFDGQQEFDQCTWLVGEDQSEPGTGSVHVFVQYVDPSLPIGDAPEIFTEQQNMTADAVEVDGVGDAAYFSPSFGSLDFLVGDRIFFVQAVFIPERADAQESLQALAQLVVERV
jgi:hypothetical protein